MNITCLKIVSFGLLIAIISCKREAQPAVLKLASAKITYAKGFEIFEEKGYKKLIIKSAYQNASKVATYHLYKKCPLLHWLALNFIGFKFP